MPTACDPDDKKHSLDICYDDNIATDLPPFDQIKSTTPPGFHVLLEKVIRAILLNRPVRIYQFASDFLSAELERKALLELQCGCLLKKSMIGTVYPSASCTILDHRYSGGVEVEVTEGVAPDDTELETEDKEQPEENYSDIFTDGPIPIYELHAPALDRYRECVDLNQFFAGEFAETNETNCPCGFCVKRRATEQESKFDSMTSPHQSEQPRETDDMQELKTLSKTIQQVAHTSSKATQHETQTPSMKMQLPLQLPPEENPDDEDPKEENVEKF